MMYRIRNWLVATLLLLCTPVGAATLSDIQVSNGNQQARITLSFIGDPDYAFSHQSKRTVALDIKQTGVIQGLPLLFSGNNLVKAIRSGTPKDAQTLRLVVDLTENGKTEAVKRQNGSNYTVVFTINADKFDRASKKYQLFTLYQIRNKRMTWRTLLTLLSVRNGKRLADGIRGR